MLFPVHCFGGCGRVLSTPFGCVMVAIPGSGAHETRRFTCSRICTSKALRLLATMVDTKFDEMGQERLASSGTKDVRSRNSSPVSSSSTEAPPSSNRRASRLRSRS